MIDHIYIFNRFGKVITEILPNDASQWNGRSNGKILPETDYWYLIQYKNGKQVNGNFSLKRQ